MSQLTKAVSVAWVWAMTCLTAAATEIGDRLTFGGLLAGAYQFQDIDRPAGVDDVGRGAIVFQPELSFTPTPQDQLFVRLGFAAGNGLNDISPFVLIPWIAPLEDDVKDINGSNRDYLLIASYKHVFEMQHDDRLGITAGLIDSTDYIDDNRYSNDEFTQFMNPALVNAPNGFVPSFDWGGALEWDVSDFSLRGVFMRVAENDDGVPFNFYALQFGYHPEISWGEGNYRLLVDWSSRDFSNPAGTGTERRRAIILSADQQLGEILGGWLRIAIQNDDTSIDYRSIYSGGINIEGALWRRPMDNIGIGYAFLSGGNSDIDDTQVVEAYSRLGFGRHFALTCDVQFMRDEYRSGDVTAGFIFGIRLTAWLSH